MGGGMRRDQALLALGAVVAAIAAVLLWAGGISASGTDCGTAVAAKSFDIGYSAEAHDCENAINERRAIAVTVTVGAVGAGWLSLTRRDVTPRDVI